jgi:hypothetical protein
MRSWIIFAVAGLVTNGCTRPPKSTRPMPKRVDGFSCPAPARAWQLIVDKTRTTFCALPGSDPSYPGSRHGPFVVDHPESRKTGAYRRGRQHGLRRLRTKDGKHFEYDNYYNHGIRVGTWKSWFDGKLSTIVHYRNGRLHGRFAVFDRHRGGTRFWIDYDNGAVAAHSPNAPVEPGERRKGPGAASGSRP